MLKIGHWMVKPSENLIFNNETKIQLESRVMAVLLCLAKQPGKTVSIETLIDSVWKGQVVSNSAVYRSIAELRKALESDGELTYIKTISKKGYCLVQKVSVIHSYPKKLLIACGVLIAVILIAFFIKTIALFNPQSSLQHLNANSDDNNRHSSSALDYQYELATTLSGREFDPSLSPDGSLLLFAYQENQNQPSQIYLQTTEMFSEKIDALTNEGKEKYRLKSFPLTSEKSKEYYLPTWSHDGQSIAYIELSNDLCSINLAQFDSQNLSMVAHRKLSICSPLGIGSLEFTANSRQLVYSSMISGKINIHLTDIDSLDTKIVLKPEKGNDWNYFVAASPFSQRLLIARYESYNQTAFYQFDIDNNESKLVYTTPSYIHSLAWGSSANSILFSEKNNTVTELNLISGEVNNFLGLPNNVGKITKASKNNIYAIEQFSSSLRSIKIKNMKTGIEQNIPNLNSSYGEFNPAFSEKTGKLAFVSNRTGSSQIWLEEPNSALVQLTQFQTDGWIGKLSWSKDELKILFARQGKIYILDLTTGDLEIIKSPLDHQTLFSPAWSKDEKSVFYSLFEHDQVSLYRQSLIDQEAEPQLIGHNIRNYQPNASGDGGFFSLMSRHGIFQHKNTEQSEQLLIQAVHAEAWNSWRVTKEGIYYLDAFDKPSKLKFYDFESQNQHDVMDWPNRIYGSFSVFTAEDLVAFDSADNVSSNIVLYLQKAKP